MSWDPLMPIPATLTSLLRHAHSIARKQAAFIFNQCKEHVKQNQSTRERNAPSAKNNLGLDGGLDRVPRAALRSAEK
eukprot:1156913-Pelagomonas_calceolata.AAC.3